VRIHLGSDHAGFELKQQVKAYLQSQGHVAIDDGPYSEDPVDYPVYAERVARAVADGEADAGVLVCGTGLGMAIAANKVDDVRAVQVSDPEFARMARRHNDANVVTLPGRYIEIGRAEEILDAFLGTEFEGGRHQKRVDMIGAMEDSRHDDEKERAAWR
jgi:ribose 5-phosphate isomerase B